MYVFGWIMSLIEMVVFFVAERVLKGASDCTAAQNLKSLGFNVRLLMWDIRKPAFAFALSAICRPLIGSHSNLHTGPLKHEWVKSVFNGQHDFKGCQSL